MYTCVLVVDPNKHDVFLFKCVPTDILRNFDRRDCLYVDGRIDVDHS